MEPTDFKNVIVVNIPPALYEVAEVAEVKRPQNQKWQKWHCLGINYCYVKFFGGIGSNGFHTKWIIGTQDNWKNLNPGGPFGATS